MAALRFGPYRRPSRHSPDRPAAVIGESQDEESCQAIRAVLEARLGVAG